ncbi:MULTISPECIES: tyrosine-type recombinase/integrase [Oceanobacillus]|uniref:Core-binding (CB) domain-containing protein n=1 Tax=Oceanobacillus kimchii TaxID=746691 RepID=A0ABQ5TNA7_9BACI|nr:phage integrase N-terminal SAM-like domain-containing protein [Oceanobacillus kimchii]GLO68289.1 hypothetical protein MACH08_40730 [Oceanobacillus kimchii]
MPFGYKKYLVEKGKSIRTVDDYISLIEQFIAHLDYVYKKDPLEVFEIQNKHIRIFLDKKRYIDKIELSTLNKNITILKSFFNYLWKTQQIPVDPASKLEHAKYSINKPISLRYEMLLEILPSIITNNYYTELKKIIFIFVMHGFRIQDFQILKKDVIDNGDSILIFPKYHEAIELYGQELDIFIKVFNDALFHESDYVFVTKRHDDKKLVPIEIMGIHKHLKEIQEDYRIPTKLNTNTIRHSYAYYLYHEKDFTFENIATIFGIENSSAALLVKESERRIEKGSETLEINN